MPKDMVMMNPFCRAKLEVIQWREGKVHTLIMICCDESICMQSEGKCEV